MPTELLKMHMQINCKTGEEKLTFASLNVRDKAAFCEEELNTVLLGI